MSTTNLALVRSILGNGDVMPGQRYQDPKIERRDDAKRPYFHIRPYVPVVTETGLVRRQKSILLGFCDETTTRQAKQAKERVMATVNNGRFMVQSQIPFKAVIDQYVSIRLPQIPATRGSYENKIDCHIRPAFEKLRISDIDKPTVEAWLNDKAEAGYSHNTLLDLRKVLSAIFSQAAEWKLWQGENPCWKLKGKIGGKQGVFTPRNPRADKLVAFLAELRDSAIISADGARLIVLTSLAIGTRVCETLGLHLEDINAEMETITIARDWTRGRVGPTKTPESKRTRQAPGLAGELIRFAENMAVEGFIFGRADDNYLPPDDRDLQQHVFRPAAERAGIYTPGFGLRRFRHLNISWRMEAGAHSLEAMKSAGHTKLSTTWIYTQVDADRERGHVETIMGRVASNKK